MPKTLLLLIPLALILLFLHGCDDARPANNFDSGRDAAVSDVTSFDSSSQADVEPSDTSRPERNYGVQFINRGYRFRLYYVDEEWTYMIYGVAGGAEEGLYAYLLETGESTFLGRDPESNTWVRPYADGDGILFKTTGSSETYTNNIGVWPRLPDGRLVLLQDIGNIEHVGPNHRYVLTTPPGTQERVSLDLRTGESTLIADDVNSAATVVSEEGDYVALLVYSLETQGNVLWDARTNESHDLVRGDRIVPKFFGGGDFVVNTAMGSANGLDIWSVADQEVFRLSEDPRGVTEPRDEASRRIAWRDDASENVLDYATLKVWDTDSRQSQTLSVEAPYWEVAFNADESLVAFLTNPVHDFTTIDVNVHDFSTGDTHVIDTLEFGYDDMRLEFLPGTSTLLYEFKDEHSSLPWVAYTWMPTIDEPIPLWSDPADGGSLHMIGTGDEGRTLAYLRRPWNTSSHGYYAEILSLDEATVETVSSEAVPASDDCFGMISSSGDRLIYFEPSEEDEIAWLYERGWDAPIQLGMIPSGDCSGLQVDPSLQHGYFKTGRDYPSTVRAFSDSDVHMLADGDMVRALRRSDDGSRLIYVTKIPDDTLTHRRGRGRLLTFDFDTAVESELRDQANSAELHFNNDMSMLTYRHLPDDEPCGPSYHTLFHGQGNDDYCANVLYVLHQPFVEPTPTPVQLSTTTQRVLRVGPRHVLYIDLVDEQGTIRDDTRFLKLAERN